MQRTKLGISVGMFGAGLYFAGLFSGYMVTILLAGYVLLFEGNAWLRRCAVKSVALLMFFSFISTVLYLLPNAINVIHEIVYIFNGNFYAAFISNIVNAAASVVQFLETILFLGLGLQAFSQGNIVVPVLDNLLDKYV